MRVGIDSYSYHRLLGEVRPGERRPRQRLAGAVALVGEMVDAGAELLSLETVFLDPPGRIDPPALVDAARGRELALAWGHPYGLRWGADLEALDELLAWIGLAPALGARLVRCVVAHPLLRAAGGPDRGQLDASVRALLRAHAHAQKRGVTLAVENHGDLDARELARLLEAVPGLAACLDTANALRVGDDPVALAAAVADRVAMVHLKDVDGGTAADPRSVAYGTGVVDLDGVLDAVDDRRDLAVCVELAQLGGADVDERALVRQGVAWLTRRREARVVA